jgi:hypothetical protein
VLPCLVDLELFGIPAHVWETSTVEQFLSPHAWIQQVHPDTVNLVDLYSFRCSAWCLDPSAIPTAKDLWIAEPPVAIVEDPPVKRLLAYPINVRSTTILGPHGTAPSPPPSPPSPGDGSDEDASARRRRRLGSPSTRPNSGTAANGAADGLMGSQRRSVHERVGPFASCALHVVVSSTTTALEMGADA